MRYLLPLGFGLLLLSGCAAPPQRAQPDSYNGDGLPLISRPPPVYQYFPEKQARLRHVGAVVLEYSVSANGRPEDIRAVDPSSAEFVTSATRLVEFLRFKNPPNWVEQGGPTRRLRLQIVYNVTGLPPAKQAPGVETIVVTCDPGRRR